MIAKAKPITLGNYSPAAWVYEVCYWRDAVGDTCPADSRTASKYGGMRLQLDPGDHLRIRFINQLPPAPPDAEHAQGEMHEMLKDNPTDLHTHGLIVEPRRATPSNPTYGDYIYVLAYPKGKLPHMHHPGLDYTDKPLNYDIYIPPNHPSGLFWIHPHVHGLALNQVSYGLAGIITIGSVNSYLAAASTSSSALAPQGLSVRHLTLKDIQVLSDNSVLSQEDPDFCTSAQNVPLRNGVCAGKDNTGEEGGDYTGGRWFFSINGQVYPTITVAPNGEVWRITQASGSRSYQLSLNDDATGQPRQFQVLAIDGVAIDSGAGLAAIASGRWRQVSASRLFLSCLGRRGQAGVRDQSADDAVVSHRDLRAAISSGRFGHIFDPGLSHRPCRRRLASRQPCPCGVHIGPRNAPDGLERQRQRRQAAFQFWFARVPGDDRRRTKRGWSITAIRAQTGRRIAGRCGNCLA